MEQTEKDKITAHRPTLESNERILANLREVRLLKKLKIATEALIVYETIGGRDCVAAEALNKILRDD
jgi:hypothetical protein